MLQNTHKIVLIGYMASGKTTVGKALAKKLNRPFIDLDQYISEQKGMSVAQIFSTEGEDYFRTLEYDNLKELLEIDSEYIIALGGGTPEIEDVMTLVNQKSMSIFLYADTETLFNRLKPKNIERPLLTDLSEDLLKIYISDHLKKRSPFYFQADLTINTQNKSTETIVKKIVEFV